MNSEHVPTFRKHLLGRDPRSGRSQYGYHIECSCGWTRRSNEGKDKARSIHREHVRDAVLPRTVN